MPRVRGAGVLGVVLTAALGLSPLAPPEHAHEVEEHGHHQLLIHRHAEAHHAFHHSPEHQNVLDENELPVLSSTSAYVVPGPAPTLAALPDITFLTIQPPVARTFHPAAHYVERLIHGPPRAPASPRAPPSALAS